ncbi:hypothetical protein ACFY2R_28920 [Micromonospora olivasterospora]|uniref:hypothetical protein n=1 Tax=Micromonospora olivasterospora TaxID=1880 RepID=UPI001B884B67|nr:hypothetical protein [Micromonospora olivasterospora]
MYVKRSTRRMADGQTVGYLQLAHNEWDPVAKVSRTKVRYSFGREDQLDVAGIRRLVAALCRLLEPGEALASTTSADLRFIDSRALGGAFALDGLWRALGIDAAMRRLLADTRMEPRLSGSCSRSWRTAHWPRRPSWPRPAGSRTTS